MIAIASSLPGRVRLRGSALRDGASSARLSDHIGRWRHVESIESNPRSGSLLIRYNAARIDPLRFDARLIRTIATLFGATGQAPTQLSVTPRTQTGHGTPRVRANRIAKRVMRLPCLQRTAPQTLAHPGRLDFRRRPGGTSMGVSAAHLAVGSRPLLHGQPIFSTMEDSLDYFPFEKKWVVHGPSACPFLAAIAARFTEAGASFLVRHLRQVEQRGRIAIKRAANWLARLPA